jgi:hypothetical protein
MNEQTLATMRQLLRPASAEQQAEIARQCTTPGGCEQLTLAGAGLEDEVRELIRRRKSSRGESFPQTTGAIAIAIASGQLVDGVNAQDCAA